MKSPFMTFEALARNLELAGVKIPQNACRLVIEAEVGSVVHLLIDTVAEERVWPAIANAALEDDDRPKHKIEVGSMWLNNYSVDGVCVVRGVADGVVTYDFNGPCGWSKHHTWPLATWAANTTPISDSRIIEGMDAGRRRRFFITNEFRKARQGEYWLRRSGPQKGEVEREDCRECALAGDILIPLDFVNERFVKAEDVPLQVLLPLNFIDPAPSITPATPCTSSVHNETELEGGTKRLAEAARGAK